MIAMRIEKKAWPELFEKVLKEEKTFDVRIADFKCNAGDLLVLKEYDPKTKQYTGREIEKEVNYVLKTKDQKFFTKEDVDKYGFLVIAFN
jgi:ribosomal protein S17